jgi:hypothetical protein
MKLGGGIVLLMVAAFMGIGFLAGGASAHTLGVQTFSFLVACGIPGAGGALLLRSHLRERTALPAPDEVKALPRARWTQELVKLASKTGGRLTVVEVVGELGLWVDDAQNDRRLG